MLPNGVATNDGAHPMRIFETEADAYAALFRFSLVGTVDSLVDTLNDCADDPMWANHAEVSKETLRHAVEVIRQLSAIAKATGSQS